MEIKSVEIVKTSPFFEIVIPRMSGGGITPSGTLNITENGSYNVSDYANVIINIPGITPTGTLRITSNGNHDVTKYATANVNVPSTGITPTGTLQITQNGTVNVTNYAQVVVNVPTNSNDYDSNTQDATAVASDVLSGKTAYAKGSKITGTMPNRGAVSGTISAATGTYTIPNGYHSGSGKVKIADSEQQKIIPENIKKGITLLGVVGALETAVSGGGGSADSNDNLKIWTVTIAQNITSMATFLEDEWLASHINDDMVVLWFANPALSAAAAVFGGFKRSTPMMGVSHGVVLRTSNGTSFSAGSLSTNLKTPGATAGDFYIGTNGQMMIRGNTTTPVRSGTYTIVAAVV